MHSESEGDEGKYSRVLARLARRAFRSAVLAASLGALGACVTKDGVTEAEDARMVVLASPSEQRVAQGAVTLFTVVADRIGFTGDIRLSVDTFTVPTGVTVTFDPAVLTPGVIQSTARVSVSANAPVQYVADPPVSNIRVRATGPGTLRDSTLLKLRLVPSNLAGITVNVTPGDVTLLVGETGEALVTIARQGNYTGAVSMDIAPSSGSSGSILAPTITPVAGVPDTWRVRFFADDVNKALQYFQAAALTSPLRFTIQATPAGLAPVPTEMRALLTVNRFTPQTTASARIAAGSEATVSIGLNKSPRFTQPITMSLENLPAGITGSFSPNPAVDDVARLTLRVATSVAPGKYTVGVLGVPVADAFASERRTSVEVEVTPFVAYRFTLPSVSVAAGSDTTAPVLITRNNGFAGQVAVTLQPFGALPTGMSVSLSPNTITGTSTSLLVHTTSATPPGQYTFAVTGKSAGVEDVETGITITVVAPPVTSNVARIEIEPRNAEITAPATQQYRVMFYDAAGSRVTAESGGRLVFSSSQPAVATVDTATGLATPVGAGVTTITARYLRNNVQIRTDATQLTVYAQSTPGHYGSATLSTNNNQRTLRQGDTLLVQLIVRNANGTPVTSGVTPTPTVSSSSGSVSVTPCAPTIPQCLAAPGPGYFYIMTAATNATVGSTVRIRYDVMGAGGEITMTIVP